jgi:hypothetical protein
MLVASRRHLLATLSVGATLAAAASASVALGATLTTPATATVGGTVTVRAGNLIPGRYQLLIAYTEKHTQGGQAINCTASIGPVKAVKRSATFSGTIPSRLVCRTATGSSRGTQPVVAGRYDLAVDSPAGGGTYDGSKSFLQHSVQIVG